MSKQKTLLNDSKEFLIDGQRTKLIELLERERGGDHAELHAATNRLLLATQGNVKRVIDEIDAANTTLGHQQHVRAPAGLCEPLVRAWLLILAAHPGCSSWLLILAAHPGCSSWLL